MSAPTLKQVAASYATLLRVVENAAAENRGIPAEAVASIWHSASRHGMADALAVILACDETKRQDGPKHTPSLLNAYPPDEGEHWEIEDDFGHTATVYGEPATDGKANAERLAACWNACAGMADPAAEISALRAQVAAIAATLPAYGSALIMESDGILQPGQAAYDAANAYIAKMAELTGRCPTMAEARAALNLNPPTE